MDIAIFYIAAIVAVAGAIMMILQRNPVASVLYLIISLLAQAMLFVQLKATAITAIYSFVVFFVILKVLDAMIGIRTTCESEKIGLDLTEHRESAYTMLE